MISLIFFLSVLFFGFLTSYEDIRDGKIRNKYVLSAFIFAFFLNSLLFFGFLGDWVTDGGYYSQLALNVFLAFLAGFALWAFNLWTSGDAKLFSAYAALVPLKTYKLGYIEYFPSFTLLGNTFLPLFFLLLLITPFSIKNSDKRIRNLFNPGRLVDGIIFVFGFSWFFDVLSSFLGLRMTFLMYPLLFMAVPPLLKRGRFITLTHVSIALSALRLISDFNRILTFDFLIFFVSLVFVFVIVMSVIGLGSFIATTSTVNIKNLKPGMILAERVGSDNAIGHLNRGLTGDEIVMIDKLYRENKLKSDLVNIQQTLPFAPLLFSGVLLTYLCEGDVMVFLENLFFT